MITIGADYRPGFQQIAFVDSDTGELQERRLEHREEAEKFYPGSAATAVAPAPDGAGTHAKSIRAWEPALLWNQLHQRHLQPPLRGVNECNRLFT